ncbi:glycerol-3-phosphate 1-O-acyltransferase PlsB [Alteromonas confluentis]|uniref:Glycerol-3-phosphate acyltransferase n=1 Tax=Alteromonas confluentis TaxID=1656094 RepID=A0A1E7ZDQ0_9ALTE|nr:glycerol-3-phosphate 1-O-acyltransferase PlsB [Alteromonas confluentis]OFC71584.1 glycerol-3-phosphate 1-O-acyltransferase [Alteromonas confluentis]
MSWMRRTLLSVFHYPVKLLVKDHNIPANVESELGIDRSKPIIYLLPTNSVTDQLALKMSTQRLGLPSPTEQIELAGKSYPGSVFLRKTEPLIGRSSHTDVETIFSNLFHLHRDHDDVDVQVVPVFVSWGRAPGKGKPGLGDLIAHHASPSWLRKFFIVIFLGRDNFINFSKAVSAREMSEQHGTDDSIAHKLVRVASTHFHRKRQSMTGPTLLERQELYNAILGSESVKRAMGEEKGGKKAKKKKDPRITAKEYVDEIAADYREGLIRFGDRILTRIWNKIYNGISVGHSERIRELAANGHEIIYVPCHRSHMDYMLLTYVIYHEGMVTPHIAAGINLNFWPAGPIFRRSGAFFLRRSFAGNKLYTAVFREYLELLFNKGYSVKYYPEGGRSRTGRLIPPKTGMLAMTMQAILKGVQRPVSIVPVYIGYENVMEVKSYLSELKGSSKKKESNLQVFSAIRKLKNYGHGYVNFGEPIHLNQFLEQGVPDWRQTLPADPEKKPGWLTPLVNDLAHEVMLRINSNAAINGMALISLCLLSSKTRTMSEKELVRAMDSYLSLLRSAPFSDDATIPDISARKMLEETLALKRFDISQDGFGTMIAPQEDSAVFLTYYRNNILHLFALPGIIMSSVFARPGIHRHEILRLMAALYPLLQRELFIYMTQDEALAYTDKLITAFIEQGMVIEMEQGLLHPPTSSDRAFHPAWLLSRCMQETFQRYAVVLTIIERERVISRNSLERCSRQVAERLSTLYGMNSPEFYDKNVLSSFISALRENHWLDSSEDGSLKYSEESDALRQDVLTLVWPEITQHLQSVEIQNQ